MEKFISVKEFKSKSGLCLHSVYRGVKMGVIPHTRVGNRILIPDNATDRMLITKKINSENNK